MITLQETKDKIIELEGEEPLGLDETISTCWRLKNYVTTQIEVCESTGNTVSADRLREHAVASFVVTKDYPDYPDPTLKLVARICHFTSGPRYFVLGSGEVVFSRRHADEDSINEARIVGFRIW